MTHRPVSAKLHRLGEQGFPNTAHFEVTGRCNARCDYCFVVPSCSQKELSTSEAIEVLDKLAGAGILSLVIGGGEPFLRSDIVDLLAHAVNRNFFRIDIMTNGTLLNEAHVQFIAGNRQHISGVQFSVFSHRAEVHDRYMGLPGALAAIEASATRLFSMGVAVKLALNLFDFNLPDLPATVQHFRQKGLCVGLGITKFMPTPELRAKLSPMVSEDFLERVIRSVRSFEPKDDGSDTPIPGRISQNARCRGLSRTIAVDHTGRILPCILMRNRPLGNILEISSLVDHIGRSKSYWETKALTKEMVPQCSTCGHSPDCFPCPAQMLAEHDGRLGPVSARCNYARALERCS